MMGGRPPTLVDLRLCELHDDALLWVQERIDEAGDVSRLSQTCHKLRQVTRQRLQNELLASLSHVRAAAERAREEELAEHQPVEMYICDCGNVGDGNRECQEPECSGWVPVRWDGGTWVPLDDES